MLDEEGKTDNAKMGSSSVQPVSELAKRSCWMLDEPPGHEKNPANSAPKSCNRKRKARNRCDYGERQCSDSDSTDDKVVLAGVSLASVGSVTNMSIATDLDVEFPQREIVTEEEWNIQNEQSDTSNENENGRDDDNGDDDGKFQLCNLSNGNSSIAPILDSFEAKALRRAEKKRKKAERRAQKMGLGDPTAGQKPCTLCSNSVNLLIRCTYDASGVWVSV